MDPAELIPHAGPMCWLDRVVEHTAQGTRCALVVRASTPLSGTAQRVPAHAALEYMAQTAAVHAVLHAREAAGGAMPQAMSLLGTRRLVLSRGWLEPGESLIAEAAPAGAARSGLAVFDARVRDAREREVASARLNLYAEPGEA